MSQDATKMIHGPMSFAFGDTSPTTVSPVNDSFVKFFMETKESTRETSDGKELVSTTGRKCGIEMTFDEVDPATMDTIEGKKGEKVTITMLDKVTNNTLVIDDLESISCHVADMKTTVKAQISGDAESDIADMFAVSTV